MKKVFNTIIGMMTLAALFLTACGSASTGSDGALSVLASTSFLTDIAQNVAGDRLQVQSLLLSVPIRMLISQPHLMWLRSRKVKY